jgi:hypothetical protein
MIWEFALKSCSGNREMALDSLLQDPFKLKQFPVGQGALRGARASTVRKEFRNGTLVP